jgi:hypothetical protein
VNSFLNPKNESRPVEFYLNDEVKSGINVNYKKSMEYSLKTSTVDINNYLFSFEPTYKDLIIE